MYIKNLKVDHVNNMPKRKYKKVPKKLKTKKGRPVSTKKIKKWAKTKKAHKWAGFSY